MTQQYEKKKIALDYVRKNVTQNNHEGCVLPPGLTGDINEPLYLLIAKWCLQQQAWVGRKLIAQAFQISERRASFQISYLTRKPHLIRCELRRVKNDVARNSSYEVWVHGIDNNALPAQPIAPKARGARRSKVGNASDEMRAMLHQLWTGRGGR